MYVLTIDQHASGRGGDRVPHLLRAFDAAADIRPVLRAERTVGDEVQVVLAEAAEVAAVVETACRQRGWAVGIGTGTVEAPLPASTRSARGSAFAAARRAVERAKTAPGRIAVVGPADSGAARRAESALWLLTAVEGRRTDRGWQVVDAMRAAVSQREVAHTLGVSVQAVSQVLRAAGWAEAERGRELATWLLEQL